MRTTIIILEWIYWPLFTASVILGILRLALPHYWRWRDRREERR
jgi:hypothetical protein